jgi:hypothetical protein
VRMQDQPSKAGFPSRRYGVSKRQAIYSQHGFAALLSPHTYPCNLIREVQVELELPLTLTVWIKSFSLIPVVPPQYCPNRWRMKHGQTVRN